MAAGDCPRAGQILAVLHPVFALTGIIHAIGGPLLPSLAATFQLTDSQAGLLLFFYFTGTSLGALLCVGNYARSLALGFAGITVACLGVALASRALVLPLFLAMGICVGIAMSAVSMFAGRNYTGRSAATFTFLNFSWSVGALIAPLLAARLLTAYTYRAAYGGLASVAALAALACRYRLVDSPEQSNPVNLATRLMNVRFISMFAFLTFLEVGIENTAISWLATYALRSEGSGMATAAAYSSLYWVGFLASRGVSSLLLLRVEAMRVFHCSVIAAASAAVLLISLPASLFRGAATFLLGAALAPIFPLLLARFFAGARHTSDSRWVLAICGFGGSALPWLTGWISNRTGSLRIGLITIPAALVLMMCMLPALGGGSPRPSENL